MKTLGVIIAVCLAAVGAAAAPGSASGHDQVLTRISHETGVPVHTLRNQEAETGLGLGNLEKANLLANASGHSFREVVSRFKAGEGWGQIAHDAGLNLGKIVSEAHRSDKAAERDRDDRFRGEGDRDDQGQNEQARDDRDRDDRGHDAEARDDQDRDDRGRGEEARDRDDRGPREEAREDRDRDDRGDGEFARDDGDRDERADDRRDRDDRADAMANAPTKGQRHVLTRISHQTGVPTRTLRRERARTGLGFGALGKANLLARATGHSFRQVVSRFRSGEGFGKIAHDAGLKLGKLVSRAHRSNKATKSAHVAHAQSAHGKSAIAHNKSSAHGKSAMVHSNSGLHGASSVSNSRGQLGRMNGFGHPGFAPAHSGANHGMGHGHGGGGR